MAVLGFFYEIDEDGKDYEMFKKLNNPLKKITTTRRTKPTIQSFNLKDFLPEDPEKEDFYRYNGSLTTPGCNQVVTWTVFKGCMTFQPLNSTANFSNMNSYSLNFCPLLILMYFFS